MENNKYKFWRGFICGVMVSCLVSYIIAECPRFANPNEWVKSELRYYLNEISRTQTTIDGVIQYMRQHPPKFSKGKTEPPIFDGNKIILRVCIDDESWFAWQYLEAYTYINNGEEPSHYGNFFEENCEPKK